MKKYCFAILVAGVVLAFVLSSCVSNKQIEQLISLTQTAASDMELSIKELETEIGQLQLTIVACDNNECNVKAPIESATEDADLQAVAVNDFLCKTGPSENAAIAYTVLKGTKVVLIGRDKSNLWVFISDVSSDTSCWVQIKNLQSDSNLLSLPIQTPSSYLSQASPTPRKQEYSTPEPSYPNP